jgi:meckelin
MGVLSAFAVLWSAMETWSWSRRSGKSGIDPLTLAKLVVNTCGNLAHVFLAVIFFTSLFWFIFFKQQNYLHVMLPNQDQEQLIKNYVISIFALKLIDVGHLLVSQMSVDIFLLDWERPRPISVTGSGNSVATATKEMAVSVWRTYLVANEWNELQTARKINHSLQIVLVIFVLRVTHGLTKVSVYYMSLQYRNKSKSQLTSPTPAQLPAVAVSSGQIA